MKTKLIFLTVAFCLMAATALAAVRDLRDLAVTYVEAYAKSYHTTPFGLSTACSSGGLYFLPVDAHRAYQALLTAISAGKRVDISYEANQPSNHSSHRNHCEVHTVKIRN